MIPLFSPQRQNEPLLKEIQGKVEKVLRSGEFILGPEVDALEQALSKKLDYRHAIGCASGTEALVLALKACNIEPGSDVITPAFSFVASASAVAWAGYRPVFADVSLDTGNVTLETVQKAFTPRTRAVIAVDLYGRQAPIAELRKWCDPQGLFLIEDGAQSIGVPQNGAHAFTTSFYPTKNLGAIGDGGAVLTNDGEIANGVRELTRHGGLYRDQYLRVGTTGRLDSLQAAVLNVKLPHLANWTALRRTIASWYHTYLGKYADSGQIHLPPIPADPATHVWALFTIRLKDGRNAFAEALKERGVGSGVYYSKAISQQPSMQMYSPKACPNAERLASEVLSLPLYPELTGKEFDFVVKTVSECLEKIST